MALTVVLLLGCAALIYFACEFFVNGIEWIGRKAGIAETAVGTILAAMGTALPESVVTFVAVAFGKSDASRDIGVGAAIGGPLVLSTIAYAVVGVVLLSLRSARPPALADRGGRLSRDQGWFLVIFVLKVGLGLVAFSVKPWFGVLFLAAYAFYFWSEMTQDSHGQVEDDLAPLKLRPHGEPTLGWALLQTTIALVVIFAGSQLFVVQLENAGELLGVSPAVIALLLSPVATELPETMNAIIWVRRGKTELALANIRGSMMIQATVPSAFGLFFTAWLLGPPLLLAAAVTAVSILGLLVMLKRNVLTALRLSLFALLYGAFAVGLALL